MVAPISQASAEQRAGRAGRERPGKCYRLYTEDAYATMRPVGVPDIQKSNLLSTILRLKALGIDNVMQFDWIAPAPAEFMVRALEVLYALGVMDTHAKLTSALGYQVAEVPLDPMSAKVLLTATESGCGQEGLAIAAVTSDPRIWASGRERKGRETIRSINVLVPYMILFSVVKPSVHVMDLHLASVVNNWCQPIACSIRRSSLLSTFCEWWNRRRFCG